MTGRIIHSCRCHVSDDQRGKGTKEVWLWPDMTQDEAALGCSCFFFFLRVELLFQTGWKKLSLTCMASHQATHDGCRGNGDCISVTASQLFLERRVHGGLSVNFVWKWVLKITHALWMIGTWLWLKDFADSLESNPLPTKHFIQTSISISNQCVVLAFFSPTRASRLAVGVADTLPYH